MENYTINSDRRGKEITKKTPKYGLVTSLRGGFYLQSSLQRYNFLVSENEE